MKARLLGSNSWRLECVEVAKKKVHFPQIPLTELKKILGGEVSLSRRPRNVRVEKRKGKEPYSLPVQPEEHGHEWQWKAMPEGRGVGMSSFGAI